MFFFKKKAKKATSDPVKVIRLRMFFGLSIPDGGVISEEEWMLFQRTEIVKVFDNFNVVESVGYYKGEPERSKILTAIMKYEELEKAKKLAAIYSKQFRQESVMLVSIAVMEWDFVGADYIDECD